MSEPASEQGLTSCILDLGAAPLMRVMALFDQLRRAGVRRVDLGQLQN